MKVGDYVRTRDGLIGKIQKNDDGIWISLVKDEDPFLYIHKEDIIKNCKDIISLVEVGDYVNDKKVEWIGYGMYQDTEDGLIGVGDKFILFNEFTKDSAREKDIKSIVTKEQFSQMEYKLGE